MKIVMKRDKECKGSVRFATTNEDAAVSNVYVSRAFLGNATVNEVTITVELGNTAAQADSTNQTSAV